MDEEACVPSRGWEVISDEWSPEGACVPSRGWVAIRGEWSPEGRSGDPMDKEACVPSRGWEVISGEWSPEGRICDPVDGGACVPSSGWEVTNVEWFCDGLGGNGRSFRDVECPAPGDRVGEGREETAPARHKSSRSSLQDVVHVILSSPSVPRNASISPASQKFLTVPTRSSSRAPSHMTSACEDTPSDCASALVQESALAGASCVAVEQFWAVLAHASNVR